MSIGRMTFFQIFCPSTLAARSAVNTERSRARSGGSLGPPWTQGSASNRLSVVYLNDFFFFLSVRALGIGLIFPGLFPLGASGSGAALQPPIRTCAPGTATV